VSERVMKKEINNHPSRSNWNKNSNR
jgi:hypothetical protein